MNYVFVLVLKEKVLDAQQIILTAVDSSDLSPMYEYAETYASDNVDLLCKTYHNGELMEISIYDKDIEDFEKIVEFE